MSGRNVTMSGKALEKISMKMGSFSNTAYETSAAPKTITKYIQEAEKYLYIGHWKYEW